MNKSTDYLGGLKTLVAGLALLAAGSLILASPSVLAGGATRTNGERPTSGANPVNRANQQSAERYLEIVEIKGTVIYEIDGLKSEGRPAKVGDRLRASGEGISTGSNSSAKLVADSGIGTVDVSENTNLQVKSLKTLPNGAKTTDLSMSRGRNRVQVRPLTNPRSRFTIQTPTGVAGVRGTEFTVVVLPQGETQVFTASGEVEVIAQNQTQRLTSGSFSVILPGKPPTSPNLISGNVRVSLQLLPAPDEGKVRVSGAVNPINSVVIDGQALALDPTGQFNTVTIIPPNRRLTILIRTPLEEQQTYELIIP